ncbi:class I SAM-dependent methyltransferase [Consotaella salsifontis]|uniref:Methyltransferase domain-containing protein n=1 Tax=Consotaella salsifontis TaxID=1365950 RepID=A0A1T4PVA9_9HYPH|nr:class I SAM-dependent methyltransferase [Consotaella salsifontis]SJZ95296.1 Methyltransferase domain-containing protein [Consotaella salsifontis]
MWDENYDRPDYLFGTEPNAFLKRSASYFRAGQTALAIADGEGRNGVWLARQGLKVTSMDLSAVGLEKARRLAERHNVTLDLVQGDVTTWDWPKDQFDIVVAIFVQFAAPPLRDEMFVRMREAARPGGLILVEGYRPAQILNGTGGPSQIDQLYTANLLRTAFADCEILLLEDYDADLDEGERHKGPSALIDLIARRPA